MRYRAIALLVMVFLAIDAAVPATIARMSRNADRRGELTGWYPAGLSFSPDILETHCSISGSSAFVALSELIVQSVFFFLYGQMAVCGAWLAIGPGRWLPRACLCLLASGALYSATRVGTEGIRLDAENLPSALAMVPLITLSASLPVVGVRAVTGRWLVHRNDCEYLSGAANRFSLKDILAATALVAATLALARVGERGLRNSVGWDRTKLGMILAALLATSALFSLPVLWSVLVLQRRRSILLFTVIWILPWLALFAALAYSELETAPLLGCFFLPMAITAIVLRRAGFRLLK